MLGERVALVGVAGAGAEQLGRGGQGLLGADRVQADPADAVDRVVDVLGCFGRPAAPGSSAMTFAACLLVGQRRWAVLVAAASARGRVDRGQLRPAAAPRPRRWWSCRRWCRHRCRSGEKPWPMPVPELPDHRRRVGVEAGGGELVGRRRGRAVPAARAGYATFSSNADPDEQAAVRRAGSTSVIFLRSTAIHSE